MRYRLPHTNILFSFATAMLVVVLDLKTKDFWFGGGVMWQGFTPLLATVQHRNYGLLFNLPAPIWFIVGVSFVVLASVLWLFGRKLVDRRVAFALGLLVGGAVGNGYDRVTLGFVRDWVLAFERSAFNVADVAIAVGLLLLLFHPTKKIDELV